MYTHSCMHTHTRLHVCMCTHTHAHKHTCTHISTRTHTYAHAHDAYDAHAHSHHPFNDADMNMCVYIKVIGGHQRLDGILADFCDFPKFKSHPLFGKKPNALQILLFFDECELCNPLGSFRKKHKLD